MARLHLLLPLLACVLVAPAASQAPSSCGDRVVVRRGDTLSSIAERCDATERQLIRLNPTIEGSRDLRAGMELRTRGAATSTGTDALDHLGAAMGEAAEALSGLARDAQSSLQDLLDKSPDLRRRLGRLGEQFSGGASERTIQGRLTVEPREAPVGETLAVTASGLPDNAPVVVGAGRPGAAYEVIERTRTGADGSLRTSMRIPDWAADLGRLVVVVAAEGNEWKIRSQPVTVTGSKL